MSVDSDFKKALDYFKAGGSANIKLAMDIFLKLAKREGIPEAWYMLGSCYDKCGDPVEATKWMLMAAKEGVKQAQFDVAIAYEMGKGVPQNYEEAAKWYREAAAQGVKEAQDNLNELINEGKISGGSPSSKSSNTPPSSATSKPAAPVAPKPAPAPVSNVWQYKAPTDGHINETYKDYGDRVKKGAKLFELDIGRGRNHEYIVVKAEIDGTVKFHIQAGSVKAGQVILEIIPK
jgi:TPR repeat protein